MSNLLDRLNAADDLSLIDRLNSSEQPSGAPASREQLFVDDGIPPSPALTIGPPPTDGPLLDVGTDDDVESSPLPTELIIRGQAAIVTAPITSTRVSETATQRRIRQKRETLRGIEGNEALAP